MKTKTRIQKIQETIIIIGLVILAVSVVMAIWHSWDDAKIYWKIALSDICIVFISIIIGNTIES